MLLKSTIYWLQLKYQAKFPKVEKLQRDNNNQERAMMVKDREDKHGLKNSAQFFQHD